MLEAVAATRGVAPEEIPHWYELDDSTYERLRRELRTDDDLNE